MFHYHGLEADKIAPRLEFLVMRWKAQSQAFMKNLFWKTSPSPFYLFNRNEEGIRMRLLDRHVDRNPEGEVQTRVPQRDVNISSGIKL